MKRRVNGITLNVEERGNGANTTRPVLVFLHYFGGSSRAWFPLIDLLEYTFYCVAPDLRGWGDSEATETSYAVAQVADDIAALIADLNIDRYILVGHSMGGKAALALAARQPTGLSSLILLAPSPPTPEPIEDAERARLLQSHPDRTEAEATVRKITAQALPAPLFEQAVNDNVRSSQPAWEAWLRHGSREAISDVMPQIAVPVRVVSGASDTVLPSPLLEKEVVVRLSNARLTILPQVGHLLPLEAPEAVAEIIQEEGKLSAKP